MWLRWDSSVQSTEFSFQIIVIDGGHLQQAILITFLKVCGYIDPTDVLIYDKLYDDISFNISLLSC